MRLHESISEHTRDLAITRGAGTTYLESVDDRTKDIRKQLDSNSDREKLDAMKKLIAVRRTFDSNFTCPMDPMARS